MFKSFKQSCVIHQFKLCYSRCLNGVLKTVWDLHKIWWQQTQTNIMQAIKYTANSPSINHLLGTVTTWCLDSDCVVTIVNYQQHGDWAANDSAVTVLQAVFNSDYTVTVQSLY